VPGSKGARGKKRELLDILRRDTKEGEGWTESVNPSAGKSILRGGKREKGENRVGGGEGCTGKSVRGIHQYTPSGTARGRSEKKFTHQIPDDSSQKKGRKKGRARTGDEGVFSR